MVIIMLLTCAYPLIPVSVCLMLFCCSFLNSAILIGPSQSTSRLSNCDVDEGHDGGLSLAAWGAVWQDVSLAQGPPITWLSAHSVATHIASQVCWHSVIPQQYLCL